MGTEACWLCALRDATLQAAPQGEISWCPPEGLSDRHKAGIAPGRGRVDAERDLIEQEIARIGFQVDRHDTARPLGQASIESDEVFLASVEQHGRNVPASLIVGNAIARSAHEVVLHLQLL